MISPEAFNRLFDEYYVRPLRRGTGWCDHPSVVWLEDSGVCSDCDAPVTR